MEEIMTEQYCNIKRILKIPSHSYNMKKCKYGIWNLIMQIHKKKKKKIRKYNVALMQYRWLMDKWQ